MPKARQGGGPATAVAALANFRDEMEELRRAQELLHGRALAPPLGLGLLRPRHVRVPLL